MKYIITGIVISFIVGSLLYQQGINDNEAEWQDCRDTPSCSELASLGITRIACFEPYEAVFVHSGIEKICSWTIKEIILDELKKGKTIEWR